VDSSVGVIREVHAELVVDRSLVLGIRVCQHRDDVFELAYQCLDLDRGVWIQSTPMGDMAVVLIEAADLDKAFATLATSDEPFDRWFRDQIRDVHGISLEDGMPLPEQVLHFDANGH
jgi:hypothetical protein